MKKTDITIYTKKNGNFIITFKSISLNSDKYFNDKKLLTFKCQNTYKCL